MIIRRVKPVPLEGLISWGLRIAELHGCGVVTIALGVDVITERKMWWNIRSHATMKALCILSKLAAPRIEDLIAISTFLIKLVHSQDGVQFLHDTTGEYDIYVDWESLALDLVKHSYMVR